MNVDCCKTTCPAGSNPPSRTEAPADYPRPASNGMELCDADVHGSPRPAGQHLAVMFLFRSLGPLFGSKNGLRRPLRNIWAIRTSQGKTAGKIQCRGSSGVILALHLVETPCPAIGAFSPCEHRQQAEGTIEESRRAETRNRHWQPQQCELSCVFMYIGVALQSLNLSPPASRGW